MHSSLIEDNSMKMWIILLLSVGFLTACEQAPNLSKQTDTGRWYTSAQVKQGEPLYQANCAACHQADASGAKDWKTPLANGRYPPPPLNGTAHTWHHPLKILRKQIKIGGKPIGGTMPAFGSTLNQQEIDAILAWVQSNWSDDIYQQWVKIDSAKN
jgi:mono/diheme cytochrome c family protein